nr:4Fe-4S dicluster domain-containing protein [Candidatus Freyarchaeota archaeon]
MSDAYEKLWSVMNNWFMKLPKQKEFFEILKRMYTPEEAEFLSSLYKMPVIDAKTVEQAAEQLGLDENRVKTIFESLARRGLINEFESRKDGKLYYSLLMLLPGLIEYHVAQGQMTDAKREIHRLLEQYTGFDHEIAASNYPLFRVIPVEEKLDPSTEVLPFEKVSEYISESRSIAVFNCYCRTLNRNCDNPIEVCMAFDSAADFLVKHRGARHVTKEEALQILRDCEDHGLVHCTTNQARKPVMLCNCCSCCCGILGGIIRHHNPRTLTKSNFLPQINHEACKLCELCVKSCPMNAVWHHYPHSEGLSDDKIMILEERCIGCGVCAHKCPQDAITMVRVREEIPEEKISDAMIRFDRERLH